MNQAPSTPSDRATGSDPKVLVIDDDSMSREIMKRLLRKDGVQVVTAENGEKGLAAARAERPAAIFLDVQMPGMSGWEVLEAIKNDAELDSIPVTMLTMLDERNRAFSMGVDEYVVKPATRGRVASLLKKYIEKQEPRSFLIVEDDPSNRSILARQLRNQNCEVCEASNGEEALLCLEEIRPDMILLDLMMPVMDGFHFLEQLREDPRYSSIPVIVLTAKNLSEEDQRQLSRSVKKILQKGTYNREQLLSKIFS